MQDVRIEIAVIIQGEVMRRLRTDKDINQADFAAKCGWSQQYQSKLEKNGEHRILNADWLRICNELNK